MKVNIFCSDSHKDSDSVNLVMHGLVGLLAPRVMGQCFQLHYFLTPHDLLDVKSRSFEKITDQRKCSFDLFAANFARRRQVSLC